MNSVRKLVPIPALLLAGGLMGMTLTLRAAVAFGAPQGTGQAASSTVRLIGTVKAIAGNTITLTTQAGSEANVVVEEATRLVRIEPGQKDLKAATSARLQDVQVGDRVLVRGVPSADGRTVAALSMIVMKQTDIAREREREQEEWQHGIGGLVGTVDPTTGTITISTMNLGEIKKVAIHTSKNTILRRYAPDSVKYSDSKPGTFDQIKPGDQLRARGTKSLDGSEFTADEIVSGSFQNIAGTIASVDAATGEISVMNLLTKKPVTVTVTADTQLRKLPPMMAQALAMRLKGGHSAPEGSGAANGNRPTSPPAGGPPAGGGLGAGRAGGPADLQQLLNRLPPEELADLEKGEAVMIVATQGGTSPRATAIKLLSGVEPLLAASPKGGESTILSAWSLSAPAGGGGEAQ